MLHYVSLNVESVIGGPSSWIVTDWIKDHNDPNLIPDLAGIQHELKNDELDYERVRTYLEEYEWALVGRLSRPVEDSEGNIHFEPVTSSSIISWTITEFLLAKGGAITGIFFATDGSYKWIQKYFYDRTRWQFAKKT